MAEEVTSTPVIDSDNFVAVTDEYGQVIYVPKCKYNKKYPCRLPFLLKTEGMKICSACKLDIILRLLSRIENEIRIYLLKQGITEEELNIKKSD